jgi:hypothetical protein
MAIRLRRRLGTRVSACGGDSVIRPLTDQAELTEGLVATASAELGISRSLAYRLVAKFRKCPQVSSLLPGKRGRKAAARALSEATMTTIYHIAVCKAALEEAFQAVLPREEKNNLTKFLTVRDPRSALSSRCRLVVNSS